MARLTVSDLIEELKKHDPADEVWYFGREGEEYVELLTTFKSDPRKVFIS